MRWEAAEDFLDLDDRAFLEAIEQGRLCLTERSFTVKIQLEARSPEEERADVLRPRDHACGLLPQRRVVVGTRRPQRQA
jgi:hypothetical protein